MAEMPPAYRYCLVRNGNRPVWIDRWCDNDRPRHDKDIEAICTTRTQQDRSTYSL